MSDVEIVKVQVSLNGRERTALVYNEDRTIMQQFPATKAITRAVGGARRAFFAAEIGDDKILRLRQRLPEQGW